MQMVTKKKKKIADGATYISYKTDFKEKTVSRHKEGYYSDKKKGQFNRKI